MEIATVLKEARTKRRYTQAACAEVLGITQQAYASWEAGRTRPSRKHAAAVAKLLRIPSAQLLEAARRP